MATQVRVPVPSSVASWSNRPAPFSTRKHGRNVKFSVDNTVAERVQPERPVDAVVYTDTLPLGRVWYYNTGWHYNTGYHHYRVVEHRTGEWMCPLLPVMPEAVYTDHCTIMYSQ